MLFGRVVRVLVRRLVELMREVGVLLIAFAPLDTVIATELRIISHLWQFFWFGVILFIGSVIAESFELYLRIGDHHE